MKFKILIFFLFGGLSMKAHTIDLVCWNDGRYNLHLTNMPINQYFTIKIGNSYDTTFKIQSKTIDLSVPQEERNTPVFLKTSCTDGFKKNLWTNSASCSLPIKETELKIKKLPDGYYQVDFTVDEDDDVKEHVLKFSPNGIDFKQILLLFPDDRKGRKTYTFKIKI